MIGEVADLLLLIMLDVKHYGTGSDKQTFFDCVSINFILHEALLNSLLIRLEIGIQFGPCILDHYYECYRTSPTE